MKEEQVKKEFAAAKEQYAALGVDVEKAIEKLNNVSISIHCWQGDDVLGFENPEGGLSGGIQTTGNYPGKARTFVELQSDIEKVLKLIPGNHRLSLHAIYGDFG